MFSGEAAPVVMRSTVCTTVQHRVPMSQFTHDSHYNLVPGCLRPEQGGPLTLLLISSFIQFYHKQVSWQL